MKATGIVRRIDDLGRVVIPKEIRRTMRIREGDPLEIFTDRDGEVIFKKYSPIGEMTGFAAQYAETLHKTCGLSAIICDRDSVVASAGLPKKEYADKPMSSALDEICEKRALYARREGGEKIFAVGESDSYYVTSAMPIISEGDIVGCVAALAPIDKDIYPEAVEQKLVQTAASFLGRQMES